MTNTPIAIGTYNKLLVFRNPIDVGEEPCGHLISMHEKVEGTSLLFEPGAICPRTFYLALAIAGDWHANRMGPLHSHYIDTSAVRTTSLTNCCIKLEPTTTILVVQGKLAKFAVELVKVRCPT